jgi:hypothetical protein
MPTTLERPDVVQTPKREYPDLGPLLRDVPPHIHEPKRRPARYIRWMGWLAVLLIVVATATALVLIRGGDAVTDQDGSFAANEIARFEALRPVAIVDGSFDTNETLRFAALQPELATDTSFATNETLRFAALRPASPDTSFATNETARFARLHPPTG